MELAKYFSVNNYSLDNLKNSTLWFAMLNDFNDPFEGRIKIKMRYEESTFSSRSEAEEVARINKSYFQKLNKKYFEHLNNLETLELQIGFIFDVWAHTLRKVNSEIINNDGYCCFCAHREDVSTNQLMWSHYANGLRGFCIVFDESEMHRSLIELNKEDSLIIEPIVYKDQLPEIDIYNHMSHHFAPDDYLDDLVNEFNIKSRSTKSKAWCYEREHRAISSKVGLHRYSNTQ